MSVTSDNVPAMYHPWRALRTLGKRVTLHWADLPDGILGLTDGTAIIWMDPQQRQAKRRCTLTHELVHIELGHTGGCDDRIERHVDQVASRRLIPMASLLDALVWTHNLDELAEELWVDRETLDARIACLTDEERQQIAAIDSSISRGA